MSYADDALAVLGHHCLWLSGVQHNDISVKNLMYDRREGNCGVLNDYNLAHLDGQPQPSGSERTGTMPFMALDLLADEAMDGKVERLYCHDCESFAWVLLLICCRYEDGKEIQNAPLSELNTHDYKQCFKEKYVMSGGILDRITATRSYESFWPTARQLLAWPLSFRSARYSYPNRDTSEPDINEVVDIYSKSLEKAGFEGMLSDLAVDTTKGNKIL